MKEYFEQLVLEVEGAELGNMFGKPCGKLNKKAFVSLYKEEMVFKLGKEEVDDSLKLYEGAKNWDPSEKNRGMKDWIQVPQEYKADWKELTEKAVEYLEGSKL